MGSRAADKLKEIEEVRSSLGRRLQEIEDRIPLAGYGKKAAAAVAGSSVAASALGFLVKRRFSKKKSKKISAKDVPLMQPVTVNVLPKGAAWIAAAGLAAFAGIKVYETLQRRGSSGDAKQSQRPAVVTHMPASGAGS